MDIKAKINEMTEKVKKDPSFAAKFQKEPVKAVEELLGVDLPDDQVNAVIEAVKVKMATGGLKEKLSGILGGGKS